MLEPPKCPNKLCNYDENLAKQYSKEGHWDGLKKINEKNSSKYSTSFLKCLFCGTEFKYSIPISDGTVLY